MRIGDDAIDLIIERMEEMCTKVAQDATQFAIEDERTTIKERDIQKGFDVFYKESIPSLLSAEAIHDSIDKIDNEILKDLIRLLKKDIE